MKYVKLISVIATLRNATSADIKTGLSPYGDSVADILPVAERDVVTYGDSQPVNPATYGLTEVTRAGARAYSVTVTNPAPWGGNVTYTLYSGSTTIYIDRTFDDSNTAKFCDFRSARKFLNDIAHLCGQEVKESIFQYWGEP